MEHLSACSGVGIEIVVVDNNSEDGTPGVARSKGATVVHEPVQGISRARNTGARNAKGDVLVFVDADVIVPHDLLDVKGGVIMDRRGGGERPGVALQNCTTRGLP